MKKLISAITAAVMLFSGIHTLAVDYGGYESEMPYTDTELYEQKGDFIYEKGTNTIVEYVGDSDEVVLPENTVIGGRMFTIREWKHVLIKKLTISKGVSFDVAISGDDTMRDGEYIREVMYLEEVTFAEGVTEIPDYAFRYASNITKINLPSTLKTIGAYAFAGRDEHPDPSIETLDIPDSVTTIGEGAFRNCTALKEIHLPESLEYIGEDAFYGVRVDTLHIPDNYLDIMENIIPADNYTFNGEMTVKIYSKLNLTAQENYLQGLMGKSLGEYVDEGFVIIEDTLLKYIGSDTTPTVPSNVHTIYARAFKDSNIETVTLPEGITELSGLAFHNSSLQYIDIPPTVTKIGHLAFCGTKLKEMFIPKSVEEIGYGFAMNCYELEKVIFEGTPKFMDDDSPFQSDIKLKRENIIFMSDPVAIANSSYFWDFEQSVPAPSAATTATPDPDSAPRPTSTARPTATPDPDATPDPNATPRPTATPAPEQPTLTVSTANEDIEVFLEDEKVIFPDAQLFVDGADRTQIPIRALGEMLGFTVGWDGETLTATLSNELTRITIKIDENTLDKNGESIQMDTAAVVIDDRTYIPLLFVGEAFGYDVEWAE